VRRDVDAACICLRRMITMMLTSKNLTLGDETPKVMWPLMGKLVPQLLRVVTFAYDLCCRCVIACWKGIFEKYTLCHQYLTSFLIGL
jgi:hypothetical protein